MPLGAKPPTSPCCPRSSCPPVTPTPNASRPTRGHVSCWRSTGRPRRTGRCWPRMVGRIYNPSSTRCPSRAAGRTWADLSTTRCCTPSPRAAPLPTSRHTSATVSTGSPTPSASTSRGRWASRLWPRSSTSWAEKAYRLWRDGQPVGEPGRIVAAQRTVLVKAPTLGWISVAVAAQRAPHIVDDPEAGPRDDRRVGHVVGQPFGELLALPHAVHPVRIAAVAATDVDGHRQLGLDVEVDGGAVGCGGVDCRAGRDAGAGPVVDFDPRPAELFDAPVAPNPGAVVERTESVGLLLDDQHDGEVVERHRHVEPPHALEWRVGGSARRLGFADRPDAPGPVAAADPDVGVDGDFGPVDDDPAAPAAKLGNRCAFSVTRLP